MKAVTRVSAKGQVVIPKESRERLRLTPGDELDVIDQPEGVLLRLRRSNPIENFDEITARIRSIINYDGPCVSIEQMDEAIAEMWASGGPRWDK